MRLRTYLRGLGLGIIVSTLIFSAGNNGKAAELSDDEIRSRAEELGMVDENEMLLSEAERLAGEAAKNDPAATKEDTDNVMEPLSTNEDKKETASNDKAAASDNSADTTLSSNKKQKLNEGSIAGSFLGAGAGSADGGKTEKNVKDEGEKITTVAELESRNSDAGKAGDNKTSTETAVKNDEKKAETDTKTENSSGDDNVTTESRASEEEDSSQTAANTAENEAGEDEIRGLSGPVSITVIKGESSTAVAKKLQMAGVIPNAMQFDSYLCLNGYDRKLVTGAHTIPAGSTAREIAEIITGK